MKVKSEIIDGKKRITIIKVSSGTDKTREAVLSVMGNGYRYEDCKKDK